MLEAGRLTGRQPQHSQQDEKKISGMHWLMSGERVFIDDGNQELHLMQGTL